MSSISKSLGNLNTLICTGSYVKHNQESREFEYADKGGCICQAQPIVSVI
jgi:hypothetical protein